LLLPLQRPRNIRTEGQLNPTAEVTHERQADPHNIAAKSGTETTPTVQTLVQLWDQTTGSHPFEANFARVQAIEFGDFLTMLACGSSYYAACAS
jgi:hypothetical protein